MLMKRFGIMLMGAGFSCAYLSSCSTCSANPINNTFVRTWIPKNSQYQKIFNKTFSLKFYVTDLLKKINMVSEGTGWILDYKLNEKNSTISSFYIATNLHVINTFKSSIENSAIKKLRYVLIGKALQDENNKIGNTKYETLWADWMSKELKPKIVYEAINYYKDDKRIKKAYDQINWQGTWTYEKEENGVSKEVVEVKSANGYYKDFGVIEIYIKNSEKNYNKFKNLLFDYISSWQKTTLDKMYIWKRIDENCDTRIFIAGYPYFKPINESHWTTNELNKNPYEIEKNDFLGQNLFTYDAQYDNNNSYSLKKCCIRQSMFMITRNLEQNKYIYLGLFEYNQKFYFKSGMQFEIKNSDLGSGSSGSPATDNKNNIMGIHFGTWTVEGDEEMTWCSSSEVLRFKSDYDEFITLYDSLSQFEFSFPYLNYDLIASNDDSFAYQDYLIKNNIKTFLFPNGKDV